MIKPSYGNIHLDDTEIIVTDPTTGGQKAKKMEQLGAVDPLALRELAKVAGQAVESGKYDRYNYLKGYDWSLSYDALMRHAQRHWAGEEIDPETEMLHMAHAAWHCLAQVSFLIRGVGTDDRPPEAI